MKKQLYKADQLDILGLETPFLQHDWDYRINVQEDKFSQYYKNRVSRVLKEIKKVAKEKGLNLKFDYFMRDVKVFIMVEDQYFRSNLELKKSIEKFKEDIKSSLYSLRDAKKVDFIYIV